MCIYIYIYIHVYIYIYICTCAAGYRDMDAFSAFAMKVVDRLRVAKAPSWQDWVPIYDKSALPGRVATQLLLKMEPGPSALSFHGTGINKP